MVLFIAFENKYTDLSVEYSPPHIQTPPFFKQTHLSPWMCFNLRKFKFCVVWIHFSNLFSCGSSKDLENKKDEILNISSRKGSLPLTHSKSTAKIQMYRSLYRMICILVSLSLCGISEFFWRKTKGKTGFQGKPNQLTSQTKKQKTQ